MLLIMTIGYEADARGLTNDNNISVTHNTNCESNACQTLLCINDNCRSNSSSIKIKRSLLPPLSACSTTIKVPLIDIMLIVVLL